MYDGSSLTIAENIQNTSEVVKIAHAVGITVCDALAIAVGTIHGNYVGEPKIYHHRLKEIAKAVSISLVLHGGSGNTKEDLNTRKKPSKSSS